MALFSADLMHRLSCPLLWASVCGVGSILLLCVWFWGMLVGGGRTGEDRCVDPRSKSFWADSMILACRQARDRCPRMNLCIVLTILSSAYRRRIRWYGDCCF